MSKKVKQIEKREAFLQKFGLSVTQGSKSHQRRMKRKAKEQLTGGLSDLQSALVTLEKDALAQQEPLNTIGASQDETKTEPAVKPRTIGKGGTSTLSKAQRKRVLKLERLRHPLILTNSEFSANPFQTIRTHAQTHY
ncbi:ribosome biogenesis protein SLX9-domain-containing protein [Gymnopilus junonius]|uniref:Ribosome biogenesis protein SLX9 n=1 Tax=Gymnopilus junonius TaxID=109634 RepID=A0A9P5P1N5_GYMJU|nr:ribosome biogenesis protein SLX9-domain-containing protein [Gymnopilus junonius]